MAKFTRDSVSVSGAPTITFHFDGDSVKAELSGATMHGDVVDQERSNLLITTADGERIADILVRKMPRDETLTESVMNIGSALMWSHHRYLQSREAQVATDGSDTPAPASVPSDGTP